MKVRMTTPWLGGALSALMVVLVGAPLHAATAPPAAKAPGMMGGLESVGLPGYVMPAQYSVDLVMTHDGESITMKRAIDGGRMRSEIVTKDAQMIMLERPEDQGAIYNIMPSEKMIMKMTPSTMMPKEAKQAMAKAEEPAPAKIEKLGVEKLEGRSAVKLRMTADGHTALGWFDEATGAPIRMESEDSVIEWKNLKPGPQPDKLFELPKGYELMDMDERMKEMKKMTASMPGGGAALGAMGGMGGGLGGMASGMAGNFGSQMGSNFGESIGSGIGASFGGPLGAMAGGYIGGRVGGWIGRKTADAVTPGPPSR